MDVDPARPPGFGDAKHPRSACVTLTSSCDVCIDLYDFAAQLDLPQYVTIELTRGYPVSSLHAGVIFR